MNVLNSRQYHHILSWTHDGKAFVILDPEKFQNEVLPYYFGLLKFSSFLRNLYRWGFTRSKYHGSQACPAFSNPDFVRGYGTGCISMMSKFESRHSNFSNSNGENISNVKSLPWNLPQSSHPRTCFGEERFFFPQTSCQSCDYKNSVPKKEFVVDYDPLLQNCHDYTNYPFKYSTHKNGCNDRIGTHQFPILYQPGRHDPLTSLNSPLATGTSCSSSFSDHSTFKEYHRPHRQESEVNCRSAAPPPCLVGQVPPLLYAHFEESRRKHDEIISLAWADLARRSRAFLREQQKLLLSQKNGR